MPDPGDLCLVVSHLLTGIRAMQSSLKRPVCRPGSPMWLLESTFVCEEGCGSCIDTDSTTTVWRVGTADLAVSTTEALREVIGSMASDARINPESPLDPARRNHRASVM
jgi:hypothetical protein